ncbi:calphotin-like [Sitodiplosis mosellana]|uniref:calphotin-like n=1 Tax=Sitodiplosis mosellana TaxID=263140 RepID=UPI002445044C|nr:calphotin-like [Sitodiplosis mosellana]
MNKFVAVVVLMVIACAQSKPSILPIAPVAPIAYSAPLVAPAPLPFVTATSSQVVSRNYNAAYVAPPVIAAASPYFAAPAAPLTYPSPYVAAPLASPIFL